MVSWQKIFIKKAESENINNQKENDIDFTTKRKIQTSCEHERSLNKCAANLSKNEKEAELIEDSKKEIKKYDKQIKALFTKKKYNILMVADQIKNDEYDRRFIDTCIILCEQGHNVTILATCILTTQCFEIRHHCRKIYEIGTFIPRDIFGAAKSFCYYLRSIYLAFWAYLYLKPSPDLIFCNCIHFSAMKYFRWIKNSKLLTFFQVFNINQVTKVASEYNILPTKSHDAAFDYIDEVLCANTLTSYVFSYSYKCHHTEMTVLYPTVRKPLVISIDFSSKLLIPANAFTFLSHYSLVPSAKFELIIKAFGIMYTTLEKAIRKRCYLVLMGLFKKNKVNRKYIQQLKNQIIGMNMQNRIFILTNVEYMYLRNLISVCHAYIHVPNFVVCEDVIIEAMAEGKPIIANNSGFPCEVVKHKETGYLLPPDPENFADAMVELISNHELYKNMCSAVQYIYDENFSYQIFVKKLNKIIQKYMEPNKNDYDVTENVLDLNNALEEFHMSQTTLPIINVLATHQELIMDKFYHDNKMYTDAGVVKEDI